MDSKIKSIQSGGHVDTWRNPDNSFHHIFLKLKLSCEQPGDNAGILIISDATHNKVAVFNIQSLRKELPRLREKRKDEIIAYWWAENDAKERDNILSKLTTNPVFVG